MEDFIFWLEMGLSHILDWQGYDHMLFLLALCCVFTFGDKRWVWLVSAFTIGHAISLSLSVLNVVRLPSSWIEAMIPATIAFSCIQHLWPLLENTYCPISRFCLLCWLSVSFTDSGFPIFSVRCWAVNHPSHFRFFHSMWAWNSGKYSSFWRYCRSLPPWIKF